MTQYHVWGVTHLNQTSYLMKLTQSGCLFLPARCPELTLYTIICPAVSCNGKLLERVTTAKILGVHMDEPLTWADHVTALLSSCYAALAVLRKLRNLAPYHACKQLGESLVMPKQDYGCVVFYPLPEYQTKRLQIVQTTCAATYLGGTLF